MLSRLSLVLALANVFLLTPPVPVQAQPAKKKTIEFNRDIRPILSENCFVCHGPDNKLRKADLRLDLEKEAYADRGGYKIIIPGDAAKSELFRRLTTDDKLEHMPPLKSNKKLDRDEIEIIRQWIDQGGKYQGHWAFISVQRPGLPDVQNKPWAKNPIDRFILSHLEKEEITPAPEADKITLLRRLYFDLTGLPPTPQEVDAFLSDKSNDAYEKLVDKLLQTPAFGERMAVYWLDVVRYADTGGYHSDNHRDVWMYRDYVINAFQKNKPFDQFLTEQLAGDLLPNAGTEQKIASGFNRLLQTTEEGGAQAKEYSAKYQADRVRNTSSIFLGLTMGCCECHDHKFDPVGTKEFYKFAAFFADIQERAVGRQEQTPFPSPEQKQKLDELTGKIAAVQKEIDQKLPEAVKAQEEWETEAKASKYKGIPKNITDLLKVAPDKRNDKQKTDIATHFRSISQLTKDFHQQLAAFQKQKTDVEGQIPTSLVSISGPPRTVKILPRGNWLDDGGEVVLPDVPESISPKFDLGDKRASRLDLAKWMMAEDNPLTGRVFVNRLWALYFGQGIVKSLDDFGSQGTWPSHPELLDWLAAEFRESGWNTHHMIKLMVTSNAYRQSSMQRPDLKQKDPYNLLLARQASFRLPAEMVRDNALAVSGLLIHKIGGPSVKPYQPEGYWRFLNFPTRTWVADKGENQYRRGLYTYWQRTFLHPSLLAFDAPSREECTVARPKSNTPQQALVLLNDPTYVEAARVFATRVIREGGKSTEERIQYAYKLALSRPAVAAEVKLLGNLYTQHLQQYQANPKSAEQLLRVGDAPLPQGMEAAELAAWTSVTRVIMNLHETVTRS